MPTPTIREAVSAAASGATATVNTGGATAVDDLLVCFATNDYNTAANLGPPTGTAGTWTLQATGDAGTNLSHLKIYTRFVTVGGAQTVSVSPTPDNEEVLNSTIVLTGANTSTPVDGTPAGSNGAASTSHVAPSVSPATSDALLLCGATCTVTAAAYSPPSGMTEQTDFTDGAFARSSVATVALVASGATGTKTFTGPNVGWATGSIAIQGAGGPTDTPIRPTKVSDRGTAADATAGTTTAVTVTSPTTVAVGNYLVARVAVDNSGTSGAAPGCTVTDSRNTWTVLGPGLADPGAASAGATAYLCYTKVNTAYQAADTLTFNWGGISTTAKAIVVEEWTYIHPTNPIAVAATTNDSGAAASTTAVTISRTPTGVDQLVYTCLATEGIAGDTVGTDSDSTNGTWTALTTTASANATATNNQRVSGAYKVVTAAGAQSWDSTITSRDWAAVAVVFNPPDLPPPLTKVTTGALVRASYW